MTSSEATDCEVTNRRIKNLTYLNNGYYDIIQKDPSILNKYLHLSNENNSVEDGNSSSSKTGSGDISSNNTGSQIIENSCTSTTNLDCTKKCLTVGCKRKPGSSCSYGFCIPCCIQSEVGENCPAHSNARGRKEADDKLAEQGLKALLTEGPNAGNYKKPQTKFYHFEERFMQFGQTVVIWCFADFCRRPEWNDDTFAQCLKEDAVKQRQRRRQRDRMAYILQTCSPEVVRQDSSSNISSDVKSSRKRSAEDSNEGGSSKKPTSAKKRGALAERKSPSIDVKIENRPVVQKKDVTQVESSDDAEVAI
mmetsp:Transcript_29006/g.39849  ORF Transcript_29006/g.39849 Transcript_29006/m.39849 type:complete len:307 (-) Transcript_29006:8-928(-)